jgi:hypothetical protein
MHDARASVEPFQWSAGMADQLTQVLRLSGDVLQAFGRVVEGWCSLPNVAREVIIII